MKKFLSIGLALAFCVATLSGIESQKALSNADKELLFGNAEVNVAFLDNAEMEETKGELWLTAIGITGLTWGLNCIFNKSCKDISFTSPPINW
ncbi:hypothetical protein [uncultured Helicobacter sp.]|uniref:hypothetical protein n=1 Tax=uncultured Helicobacter sp. TaxID=175537 RepID=UPI002628F3CA|nr:hypothetical protein [uncultured Helicobacter sp.]